MGSRLRMATSCARRILVMVSGHHAPAFTVASLATTTAGRPSTLSRAGTAPPPGGRPRGAARGGRPPRAGLHGRVVGDAPGGPPFNLSEAGYDARRGGLAVVTVVGDQQPDLQKH